MNNKRISTLHSIHSWDCHQYIIPCNLVIRRVVDISLNNLCIMLHCRCQFLLWVTWIIPISLNNVNSNCVKTHKSGCCCFDCGCFYCCCCCKHCYSWHRYCSCYFCYQVKNNWVFFSFSFCLFGVSVVVLTSVTMQTKAPTHENMIIVNQMTKNNIWGESILNKVSWKWLSKTSNFIFYIWCKMVWWPACTVLPKISVTLNITYK